jgi:hypothetical protein
MSSQDPYLIPGTQPPEPRQADEHPNVAQRSKTAIILSICAVVVAASAALFSFLQWKAADRQADIAERAFKLAEKSSQDQAEDVRRSRKAAEESAKAAATLADTGLKSLSLTERGANASERSARTAEESLKTNVATFKFDERPLLSLIDYKAVKSTEGKHVEFTLTVNNVGKTEAYGITRQLEVYYDHKRMAVALPQETSVPGITAGANTRLNYTIPVDLSAEQVAAVDAGSAALKVVLKLNFQNVFRDQQPETVWCLQYNPLQLDHWSPCTPE